MKSHTENTSSPLDSRSDEIVTAIGVLVLLFCAMTGNAFVVLAMSVIALGAIAIFFRQSLGRHAWLFLLIGAGAVATSVYIAFLLLPMI